MSFQSTNPATGFNFFTHAYWRDHQVEEALQSLSQASPDWANTALPQRRRHMLDLAGYLRANRDSLADVVSDEMGKLRTEAQAEVEKCASACEFYADEAAGFLQDQPIDSDANKSLVCYQPLGTVLAIMPWNFPLWQVIRFAAPALMAGNTAALKHASNVPQCALSLEKAFVESGFPEQVFRSLMISSSQTADVIADPRIHAVTLTGSTPAGRKVAATAGAYLKKTVLELGGSDAFVVLEDADLDLAIAAAVKSRFMNAGQSCIAAKRFIVVDKIRDKFIEGFRHAAANLQLGDPKDAATGLAPMARADLRSEIHDQVQTAVKQGAKLILGGEPSELGDCFYPATIIDGVEHGNLAYSDELFGPVASILHARDAEHALALANDTDFGLGGSIWSKDITKAEHYARQLQCGCAFVNGLVKSDPRLPFGGIKTSGYGRELSMIGMHEFVNQKTLWIKN